MARLIKPTNEGIAECAKFLQAGKLVSFPTETVYGLGANALDEKAVLSIFTAKGRPLTDPVIVHVPSAEKALDYINLTGDGLSLFNVLTEKFWPGPLTIVAPARSCLPSNTHAGTGFVGVRVPAHPLARRLLTEADVPVAAPSANRFGHISPTSAEHVLNDLGDCNHLLVLDSVVDQKSTTITGERASKRQKKMVMTTPTGACNIGIESTVAKIDSDSHTLVMYRRGGVSEKSVQELLQNSLNPNIKKFRVVIQSKAAPTTETQEAPGQMLKHYAPDVDTFLLNDCENNESTENSEKNGFSLSDSVIIDFNGKLAHLKSKCLQYRDLSPTGSMDTAAQSLFGMLRWAEVVSGAKKVLLVDVVDVISQHTAAVRDRMFRAASGKCINLCGKTGMAKQ